MFTATCSLWSVNCSLESSHLTRLDEAYIGLRVHALFASFVSGSESPIQTFCPVHFGTGETVSWAESLLLPGTLLREFCIGTLRYFVAGEAATLVTDFRTGAGI